MLYDRKWELDDTGKDLLAAADYIEQHGWCQHSYVSPDGAVCAVGAIEHALEHRIGKQQAIIRLSKYLRLANVWLLWLRTHPADSGDITLWNDTNGRTKEQVLEALRGAAYWRNDDARSRNHDY